MSLIDIKKEDGSSTSFGFLYDNGLPYKPVIESAYEIFSYENPNGNEINFIRFSCVLNNEKLIKFKNCFIYSGVHCLKDNDYEYWFDFKNCYMVFKNNDSEIKQFFDSNKIGVELYDLQKTLIYKN